MLSLHRHLVRGHRSSVTCAAVAAAALSCLAVLPSFVFAQGVPASPLMTPAPAKQSSSGARATNSAALTASSRPQWQELTPAQQLSLKPLALNWNTLGEAHKRKWMAIAAGYPSLAPAEQVKMHTRMTEWVALSPQQRAQARLNFAQSSGVAPLQKTATWQAYQALTPEEKEKLAAGAPSKVAGVATAARPTPPTKLAAVPVTRETMEKTPKIAPSRHEVNRTTLLPHSPPKDEPTSPQKK